MIYVLTYHGEPIAAAYRFEALNSHVASGHYTAEQQHNLKIKEVDIVK